jgi:predicted anti-sigma-YlaC factor YlaD
MALRMQPRNCERARAWVSLRMDDEISELEDALLEAHLRRCASCREFEESVCGTVLVLRAQPLEEIDHAVVVPARRRLPVRRATVASAAAVAAAVVGVTTVLSTQVGKTPAAHAPAPLPAAVTSDDQDLKQLRTLRVLQLGGRVPPGANLGAVGAIANRQLGSS